MDSSKSERALLLAVRNSLRTTFDTTIECQIEGEEQVPPTIGHRYFIIMPDGWQRGPRHSSSGGVHDHVFGVAVTVVKRILNVPKDKQREVFLATSGSLNDLIDQVIDKIDFNYDIINAANTTIETEAEGESGGFMHPLVFSRVDSRPQVVSGEMFMDIRTEPRAGLKRTVYFDSARRITSRS